MTISSTDTRFNPTITNKSALQSTAISNGSVYFVDDTKELFVDFDSKRIEITDILILNTDAQRTSVLFTPLNKFYYVLDTQILWLYKDGTWYSITTNWGNIGGSLANQTDLINALDAKQDVIDSANKLSADLIQDGATNKTVTLSDKTSWDAKLDSSAISDMATKTWTGNQGYLTEHQDISGKADKATSLAGYGILDAYTKTEIDGKIGSAMHYKGSVANATALDDIVSPEIGDVYNLNDTGANYAWNGNSWDKLSENIDLSSVVLKANVVSKGSATQPIYFDSNGIATACTYELNKTVPVDAEFTDTIYTHPTSSGNKHIPSGGSAGQILRWSADGTAIWDNAAGSSYTGGTGIAIDGSVINHTNSITAGTIGATTATSGSTLDIPYVTYDAQGHITATGTREHTVSGFSTTDTLNTAGATDTSSKIYIIGAVNQADNPQTYSQDTAFVDTLGQLNSANPDASENSTVVATTKWVTDKGYTANIGTITGIIMNGDSIGTSGVIDLGTVITQHQDISSKQDASTAVIHTASTAVGDINTPVYIASDGTATPLNFTIATSVPNNAVFTDTTYNNFTGADGSVAGAAGLVPQPAATDNVNFLRGDGTWAAVTASSAITQVITDNSTNIASTAFARATSTHQPVTVLSSGSITLTPGVSIYHHTPTASTTYSFGISNLTGNFAISATTLYTFELWITMSTVYTLTFSGVTWQDGEAPDMSSTGTYLFAFRTINGGSSWLGNLQGVW